MVYIVHVRVIAPGTILSRPLVFRLLKLSVADQCLREVQSVHCVLTPHVMIRWLNCSMSLQPIWRLIGPTPSAVRWGSRPQAGIIFKDSPVLVAAIMAPAIFKEPIL